MMSVKKKPPEGSFNGLCPMSLPKPCSGGDMKGVSSVCRGWTRKDTAQPDLHMAESATYTSSRPHGSSNSGRSIPLISQIAYLCVIEMKEKVIRKVKMN